jgi:hypothetical protein
VAVDAGVSVGTGVSVDVEVGVSVATGVLVGVELEVEVGTEVAVDVGVFDKVVKLRTRLWATIIPFLLNVAAK